MKLSKIQHRIYDIIISTLAIAAAVLVLIDLSQGLNDWKKTADQAGVGAGGRYPWQGGFGTGTRPCVRHRQPSHHPSLP